MWKLELVFDNMISCLLLMFSQSTQARVQSFAPPSAAHRSVYTRRSLWNEELRIKQDHNLANAKKDFQFLTPSCSDPQRRPLEEFFKKRESKSKVPAGKKRALSEKAVKAMVDRLYGEAKVRLLLSGHDRA